LRNYLKLILVTVAFLYPHGDGDHDHSHSLKSKGVVSGTVVDKDTNNPIEYVSVSVESIQDKAIVSGAISDENGYFYVDKLASGDYKINVEYIGYEKYSVPFISINDEEGFKKDLGRILIARKSIDIEAVEVIDDKPLYEFETDKMVYNASEDIITGSGTAEDVLKKVPMVTIDQDGEISLRGNPNVKIMVNGRPIRTDVSNITAATIDKVEVITSPSAKYDPEGMAGIINIELKKGDYQGLNGSVRFNARDNQFYGPSDMNSATFFMNYRKDKYNFYSTLSSNNKLRVSSGYRNVTTDYYSEGSTVPDASEKLWFDYTSDKEIYSKRIQLGLDYYLSDELTLNWELGFDSNIKDEYDVDNYTEPFIATYEAYCIDDKSNYDSEGIFELTKTFNEHPDRELFFSFSHHNHDDFETDSFIYDPDGDENDRNESTTTSNDLGMYEFALNYKLPIDDDQYIEFGYDGDFVSTDQVMDFNVDGLVGINDFIYDRDIQAVYFEYENKLSDKFSVKPSFRYEIVEKDIISDINLDDESNVYDGQNPLALYISDKVSNPDEPVSLSRSAFYPDLHFTYNLTDKQSIQFGVSKRVERPGSFGHGWGQRKIRPFPRDIYSEGFLFVGNPYLRPEYSTQYDISFKSPAPMGFFSSSLFYHEIEDKVEWYDDDDLGAQILTFENSAQAYEHGISLFTVLAGQVLGGTYSKTTLNDNSDNYELNEGSTFKNAYFRMNLPEQYLSPYVNWWKFDFEYGFYWMQIQTPSGNLFGDNGTLWANMSLSKQFFDNRLRVSVSVDNLYDNPGFQMDRTKPLENTTDLNGVVYNSAFETSNVYNQRNGRTFSVSIKYNFGKLEDEKSKSRQKTFGGDDNRGGGGMDMGF
tara:strand:- start:66 stop:2675 length:2610 start_codon:yes stop_codon:yes gene_type:complete